MKNLLSFLRPKLMKCFVAKPLAAFPLVVDRTEEEEEEPMESCEIACLLEELLTAALFLIALQKKIHAFLKSIHVIKYMLTFSKLYIYSKKMNLI